MVDGKLSKEVIQKAKKLTFGPAGKRFTPCPFGCGLVRAEKFDKHLKRAHKNRPRPVSKKRSPKVHRTKSTDALFHSVSGGRPESIRLKH